MVVVFLLLPRRKEQPPCLPGSLLFYGLGEMKLGCRRWTISALLAVAVAAAGAGAAEEVEEAIKPDPTRAYS